MGRVEFELASDFLPVTCENFVRLCDGVLAPAVPRGLLRYAGDSDDFEDRREEEEEDRKTKEERILCFEGTRVISMYIIYYPVGKRKLETVGRTDRRFF